MKLGELRVGGHPLDVSPGQIDFQIESCLCVSHSFPPLFFAGGGSDIPVQKEGGLLRGEIVEAHPSSARRRTTDRTS